MNDQVFELYKKMGNSPCFFNCALDFANKITPEEIQCAVMFIDHKNQCYHIPSCFPMKSDRHGFTETGRLRKPIEKTALVKAIYENKIITGRHNDDKDKENFGYMEEHAINKGIKSTAIIPIKINDTIDWLIIIDKVYPYCDAFSEKEIEYLKQHKNWIEENEICSYRSKINIKPSKNASSVTEDFVDEAIHLLLNTPLGGYTNLIRKNIGNKEKTMKIIDTIEKVSRTLEDRIKHLRKVKKFLFQENQKTCVNIKDVIQILLGNEDENKFKIIESCLVDEKISVNKEAIQFFFLELRKQILESKEQDKNATVELSKNQKSLIITILNSGLTSYKLTFIFNLRILRHLAEKLNGKMEIDNNGTCKIFLPLAEE